jgi:hypothetical protein
MLQKKRSVYNDEHLSDSSDDETLDFDLALSDDDDDDGNSEDDEISDQDTLGQEVSDDEAGDGGKSLGIKVLRRHDLPEIEADYHSDSSDQVPPPK